MTARERLAARDRIVDALRKADEGGYGSAWYFYVDRRDVEAILPTGRFVHGDAEVECDGSSACDASAHVLGCFAGGPERACCGDPGDCKGCRS